MNNNYQKFRCHVHFAFYVNKNACYVFLPLIIIPKATQTPSNEHIGHVSHVFKIIINRKYKSKLAIRSKQDNERIANPFVMLFIFSYKGISE